MNIDVNFLNEMLTESDRTLKDMHHDQMSLIQECKAHSTLRNPLI